MNIPQKQRSKTRTAEFIRPARPMPPTTPLKPNRGIQALLLALLFLPTLTTAQEIPGKAPLTKYTGLWVNSPFTSRPIIQAPDPVPEQNPLEDYSLIGVSPSNHGFRVTLLNRNDPAERIVIDSGRPNPRHDFEVLEIDRKPGRPLATTVRLSKGSSVGTIGFESAMLTLTPPPAAAPPQNAPPVPNVNPADGQQEQAQGARRVPRPRVVQPPVPPQQQGGQPVPPGAAQGNRGGARPQGVPAGGSRDRTDRRSRR